MRLASISNLRRLNGELTPADVTTKDGQVAHVRLTLLWTLLQGWTSTHQPQSRGQLYASWHKLFVAMSLTTTNKAANALELNPTNSENRYGLACSFSKKQTTGTQPILSWSKLAYNAQQMILDRLLDREVLERPE